MQICSTSNGKPNAARTPAASAPRRNSGQRAVLAVGEVGVEDGRLDRVRRETRALAQRVLDLLDRLRSLASETPTHPSVFPPDTNIKPAPETPSTSVHARHSELTGSSSRSVRAVTTSVNHSGSSRPTAMRTPALPLVFSCEDPESEAAGLMSPIAERDDVCRTLPAQSDYRTGRLCGFPRRFGAEIPRTRLRMLPGTCPRV